jgi:hypothetical protein
MLKEQNLMRSSARDIIIFYETEERGSLAFFRPDFFREQAADE